MAVILTDKGVGHGTTVYAPAAADKEKGKVAPVQPGDGTEDTEPEDGTEDTEPEEKETPKKDTKKKK